MTALSKPDLILHPIRGRILATLARREMTTRQIARALPDVSQASVYRHVTMLTEFGLLKVVREIPARGMVERVYAFELADGYLQATDLENATPEDFLRYFKNFSEGIVGLFRRYSNHPNASPQKDGVSFKGEILYLTPQEREQVFTALYEATKQFRDNGPAPDRTRFYISRILIPDKDEKKEEELSE